MTSTKSGTLLLPQTVKNKRDDAITEKELDKGTGHISREENENRPRKSCRIKKESAKWHDYMMWKYRCVVQNFLCQIFSETIFLSKFSFST